MRQHTLYSNGPINMADEGALQHVTERVVCDQSLLNILREKKCKNPNILHTFLLTNIHYRSVKQNGDSLLLYYI